MSSASPVRTATTDDVAQLIGLWEMVFPDAPGEDRPSWKRNAEAWFAQVVGDASSVRFPVVEINGAVVATAIGTLEIGVPNPQSPRGRLVRLANVITLPAHRGKGFGTAVVRDVVAWARSIDADRVDLSTSPEGQRIYEQVGFVLTKAPRMKLVL